MITTKQRAYLRALANKLKSQYQIGKGGVTPAFISLIDEALTANEMVKIHILNNSSEDKKEVANELSVALKAEMITSIGSRIVLYRESKENKKIELP